MFAHGWCVVTFLTGMDDALAGGVVVLWAHPRTTVAQLLTYTSRRYKLCVVSNATHAPSPAAPGGYVTTLSTSDIYKGPRCGHIIESGTRPHSSSRHQREVADDIGGSADGVSESMQEAGLLLGVMRRFGSRRLHLAPFRPGGYAAQRRDTCMCRTDDRPNDRGCLKPDVATRD